MRTMIVPMKHAVVGGLMATLSMLGCGDDGDDDHDHDHDAAAELDAGGDDDDDVDAAPGVDAAVDAAELVELPVVTPLSATGTDGFFGAVFDADGNFYATGITADGVDAASDREMVVAKFRADGTLDPAFGDDGIARKNVAVGGGNGESARGIVIQSDGKIVIGGAVEHEVGATGTAASDRDLALVRFNVNGTVDEDFGVGGVVRLDLNTGIEVQGQNGPTLAGADAFWSLSIYGGGDDRMIVHGGQRALGSIPGTDDPRTDTDWAMLRLDADGALDAGFADGGRFLLDLQNTNASVRAATILPDGSLIGAGYANTPGLGSTQPVVYKLTPDGELDEQFGEGGIFHQVVLGFVTEVYSIAVLGDKLVTIGYGRDTAEQTTDWVSLRLNADGTLDPTWADDGVFRMDLAGFGDNGRNLVGLPGDRVMLIGGGSTAMGANDGVVVVLDEHGTPDASFGADGRRVYDLGGPSDFFWGVSVSPDGTRAVIAGLKGYGNAGTAEANDDAATLLLSID